MKNVLFVPLFLFLTLNQLCFAQSPRESLEITVNQLLSVVNGDKNDKEKMRSGIDRIIRTSVDFDTVARKVVSKPWKTATEQQKTEFKDQFATIMVNTYFELLQNYNNEKVSYIKEQTKKGKKASYAIVDTNIISKKEKTPVRYRLINKTGEWKIYDFVVEGVSIIDSYKKTYRVILKQSGMVGLLEEMKNPSKKKKSTKTTAS